MANKTNPKYFIAGLLSVFAFALYLITLYPDIGPRDSSEFALASYVLGISHPSGYPLFVMLGKLFSYIPLRGIAERMNMVSAFFSSATILLVFLTIQRITRNNAAALVGSLTLCFSFLYWIYSVHFEVFALNGFFMMIMLFVLLIWKDASGLKKRKYLYLFSFLLGLALSHHHILVLGLPAFAYYILSNDNALLKDRKQVAICILILMIGLTPLLYLPVRAAKDPVLNWGNPSTLKGFIDVVTRAEFGKGRLSVPYLSAFSLPNLMQSILIYIRQMIDQFTLFGIMIGLFSLLMLFRKETIKIGITLFILYIMNGLFFAVLIGQAVIDMNLISLSERFYINSFIVFAVLIGIGSDRMAELLSKKENVRKALLVCSLVLPVFLLGYNYRYCDMSRNYIIRDLPANVLSSLPENSVFYAVNDSTRFGIWYMQGVLGIRPDVIAIWPFQPKWYRDQLASRYKGVPGMPHYLKVEQLKSGYYYTDMIGGPFEDISRYMFPEGLVYRVELKASGGLENAEKGMKNIKSYIYRGDYSTRAHRDLFTKEVIIWYGQAHNNVGAMLQNNGDIEDAVSMYKRSMCIIPDDFAAYFNMGVISRYKKDYADSIKYLTEATEKNPSFTPSYKYLGVVYGQDLNDAKTAVKYFEKYVSLSPSDKDLPVIMRYIEENRTK